MRRPALQVLHAIPRIPYHLVYNHVAHDPFRRFLRMYPVPFFVESGGGDDLLDLAVLLLSALGLYYLLIIGPLRSTQRAATIKRTAAPAPSC